MEYDISKYRLGNFSPVFHSERSINGHFKGMSLGLSSADATREKVATDCFEKVNKKNLSTAEFENVQRYKIARFIVDKIQKGFPFSSSTTNKTVRAEVFKIEGEVLKYRPSKEAKKAVEEKGVELGINCKPFPNGIFHVSNFLDAIFSRHVAVKYEVVRDEDGDVIQIKESENYHYLVKT